jgi:hypothetical protein
MSAWCSGGMAAKCGRVRRATRAAWVKDIVVWGSRAFARAPSTAPCANARMARLGASGAQHRVSRPVVRGAQKSDAVSVGELGRCPFYARSLGHGGWRATRRRDAPDMAPIKSSWFELKMMVRRSRDRATYSTAKLPGVSSTAPARMKETPSPRGEIAGAAPRAIRIASPPPKSIRQITISAPAGSLVGFGTSPARFASEPRTNSSVEPSGVHVSEASSCPSSRQATCQRPRLQVGRRGDENGANASAVTTHATCPPAGAADSSATKGPARNASTVWDAIGTGARRMSRGTSPTAAGVSSSRFSSARVGVGASHQASVRSAHRRDSLPPAEPPRGSSASMRARRRVAFPRWSDALEQISFSCPYPEPPGRVRFEPITRGRLQEPLAPPSETELTSCSEPKGRPLHGIGAPSL